MRSASPQPPMRTAPKANTPMIAPNAAPSTMMQQQKQPGMFAQMATTAAGVAVGSAVVGLLF